MRLTLCLLSCFLALPLSADEARGRAALQAEYDASHGYGDFESRLKMTLVSKNGRETLRELDIQQMETDGSVKTMIVFRQPRSIRGTGLLTHSRVTESDDQWLFLPAIKRVKKIASRDRSGSFVGSEFAYEDLADYVVDEFSYRWLAEEPCGELVCDVVERTPVDEYSGYSRHVVRVDQRAHRIRTVEYYDVDGELEKRLTASDFREYVVGERSFLQPHELLMENLQSGRSTRLSWAEYVYSNGFVETRDFTTNALKRAR